ncbi:MAG: endo alpha-1,4 polygalactosaminidase [Acidimicrobiales bacterium]|nr:endo alpha-1,4 polygalactosaminidase [Acidimicrobiales bacterium]
MALAAALLVAGACDDEGARGPGALAEVDRWLYLLAVPVEPDVVEAIAASSHDLVVIDPAVTETDSADVPVRAMVERLHDAGKTVVAYVDVGEAESYRTYWQEGWGIGDPAWILSEDPDGWAENYPVAYWDPEWQALWLDDGGLVDVVAGLGFDGLYLDWVEGYSDEVVAEAADADGVDPAEEMAVWVGALADRMRERRPGALVIQQNAAELAATRPDLRAVIDGLAQEQVWFDGGADGDPPGDCPLPATEFDVDGEAYVESLSPACRAEWEEHPDSTLHVSSESYLSELEALHAEGLPVLTVDYATEPEHVAFVLAESRARGFVPFVGVRSLDRWEPPR